jgi:pimeloyl-ACP methyl ester carboxylesterase
VILVGHSMGGPVIVEAARQLGGRVVGLVPVETFHDIEQKLEEEQIDEFLAGMKADYAATVEQTTRQFFFTPDADPRIVEAVVAHMKALDPNIAVALLDAMFHYDAGKGLDELSVPVRVINSTAMQPTNVEALKSHIGDFGLITMTKVGHFPMLEAPEKLNELLDTAIREVVAAHGRSTAP